MIVLTPHQRYRFTARDGSPTDEAVIRETWVENVYRIHESDLARDGAVMVDIGANIGAVTVYAASLGAHVHVVAVEPERENLDYLVRNVAANHVGDQVSVVELAVSTHAGVGSMVPRHGNSTLTYDLTADHQVGIVSLADLFARNGIDECDVLKIDAEGSEYDIIAGANLTVLRRIRYLTLEFDAADDRRFGAMVAKLAKTHGIEILGSPERGGYIYARRY